jgi:hypothetical protein
MIHLGIYEPSDINQDLVIWGFGGDLTMVAWWGGTTFYLALSVVHTEL